MFYFSLWPIFSVSQHSLFYDEVIACSSLVNHDTLALINSVAGSLTQSKRDPTPAMSEYIIALGILNVWMGSRLSAR